MTTLDSTITCPHCGHARLQPLAGDCCVFRSHGSVPCPLIEAEGACCHD